MTEADADADASEPQSSGWLEDMVAEALEALDRGGEPALAEFLARRPEHRDRVQALVADFRGTGLLARDAADDMPERLGEFRLLRRLGAGGMGVVFLAEQESLGRQVALKVIRPDLVHFGSTRERFRREIDVIARLAHPAIVPVLATGEHAGMPWYAMQFVDGVTIDEACRRLQATGVDRMALRGRDLERVLLGAAAEPPPGDRSVFADEYWMACVRLCRQSAAALEHAHRQGVVHRDVKPSTVMLTADGRALLFDFGLARVQGDPKLTRTGGEPGSPAYMAPEQVRGLAADERADVYSLAATLYQMLALQAPFTAPDADRLRQRILAGQRSGPEPVHVPAELRLVLDTAMDVDRDRRYSSADAFAADLDAVLLRRPIRARGLPLRVRATRWLQRHPVAAVVLLVLAVSAVLVPSALAWQQARSLATLRTEKARADRARDDALAAVREFLTRFGASGIVHRPGGRTVVADLLRRADELLQNMPGDSDPTLLRRHRLLAARWLCTSLRVTGSAEAARDRAAATLAEWRDEVPTPDVALLLAALRGELLLAAVGGLAVADLDDHLQRADAELAMALADHATNGAARDQSAEMALDRVSLWGIRNDPERQDLELERALAAAASARAAGHDQRLATAVLENRYGELLRDRGRLDAAEAHFQAALQVLQPEHDLVLAPTQELRLRAFAEQGLGRVAAARGLWPAAVAHYRLAEQHAERDVSAFPQDEDAICDLAGVLTELAQVEAVAGVAANEVIERLERARRLFAHCPERLRTDAWARQSGFVNLKVLSEQLWKARDGARLAEVARALAGSARGDAQRQSMAAWRSLQAAAMLAAAGDAAGAATADADALEALLACEAAGWFAPVDLAAKECERLAAEPAFRDLRARHPSPPPRPAQSR
ncbi:MAG: protein kinase [Planctomycetes bacterium]|nr:protein kinase [Planctomycetota bacterium]